MADLIEIFTERGDLAHLTLLLWAGSASGLAWFALRELAAASRRFAPPPEQAARFRIDAPLRGQVFAPYPRVAPMGFHFANPVSGREPHLRLTWSDGHREEN